MNVDTQEASPTILPLVVTPPVDPRESAIGYALRLCEANGYSSPTTFLSKLHPASNHAHTFGGSAQSFIGLTLMDASSARRLEIRRAGDTWYYLLGQRVSGKKEVYLAHHRVCPLCLDLDGIYDASWHLSRITHCPIHQVPLVSSCHDCGASFRMNRAGPGLCRCRAVIRVPVDVPKCSEATATLFKAIRAKLICDPSIAKIPAEFSAFDEVNLPAFLSLIRQMCRFVRDYHPSCKDRSTEAVGFEPLAIVIEALQHFSQGIGRVHGVLRGKGVGTQEVIPASDFRWFRRSHLAIAKYPNLAFIGKAISAFVQNQRGPALRSRGLSEYLASRKPKDGEEFHKCWVYADELVSLTDCDPLNVDKATRLKLFSWRRGVTNRLAVLKIEIARLKRSSDVGLEAEDAATIAAIPEVLFKRLSRSRIYIAQFIPETGGPYAQEDVMRLKALIQGAHSQVIEEMDQTVSDFLRRTPKSMLNSTKPLVETLARQAAAQTES